MADPKSKIRWDKGNVHQVAAKLFMTKDDDREIWEFLQQQPSMAMTIKDALRAYMKAKQAPSAAQPAEEEENDDDWLEEYMNAISPNHPDNVKKNN